ncbi:MAG: ABC transporter substrate-binding protein [Oscillospiraceae bacterium]|jgi:iron complex transport system substrate-binding protein|nr:ABC transporter substrate-binding protein [Oscillospiraceae bacterium]
MKLDIKALSSPAGALFLLGLSVLLTACTAPAAPAPEASPEASGQVLFTDALGQSVAVSDPARVVVCTGSLAEIWRLAGGDLLGATSDAFEDGFADPDQTADVGGLHDPNPERILSLRPALVILSADIAKQTALKEPLAAARVPTAYFSVETFADYLAMLGICTDITGRDDLYAQNGTAVAADVAAVLERTKGKPAPTVLLIRAGAGKVTARGSDTMAGSMLKEMGCVNIADSAGSLLSDLSLEVIIQEDPDYILAVAMGDETGNKQLLDALFQSNPAWRHLAAFENNRYVLLPKDLFHQKPNNRWAESYECLWDILYGA